VAPARVPEPSNNAAKPSAREPEAAKPGSAGVGPASAATKTQSASAAAKKQPTKSSSKSALNLAAQAIATEAPAAPSVGVKDAVAAPEAKSSPSTTSPKKTFAEIAKTPAKPVQQTLAKTPAATPAATPTGFQSAKSTNTKSAKLSTGTPAKVTLLPFDYKATPEKAAEQVKVTSAVKESLEKAATAAKAAKDKAAADKAAADKAAADKAAADKAADKAAKAAITQANALKKLDAVKPASTSPLHTRNKKPVRGGQKRKREVDITSVTEVDDGSGFLPESEFARIPHSWLSDDAGTHRHYLAHEYWIDKPKVGHHYKDLYTVARYKAYVQAVPNVSRDSWLGSIVDESVKNKDTRAAIHAHMLHDD
jgi:hypothetical protein